MVPPWPAFVEVFLALHMHQVEFVNQAVPFQKSKRAVDRDPVNLRVETAGTPQQLAGIEVLLGGFHHAEDGAALTRHAQSARHEFSLQTSRNLGFGQWHGSILIATRMQHYNPPDPNLPGKTSLSTRAKAQERKSGTAQKDAPRLFPEQAAGWSLLFCARL